MEVESSCEIFGFLAVGCKEKTVNSHSLIPPPIGTSKTCLDPVTGGPLATCPPTECDWNDPFDLARVLFRPFLWLRCLQPDPPYFTSSEAASEEMAAAHMHARIPAPPLPLAVPPLSLGFFADAHIRHLRGDSRRYRAPTGNL